MTMAGGSSEITQPKQSGLIPWKPGQSGNPAGRPKGARAKIGEDFLKAMLEDFNGMDDEGKVNGIEAIRKVRLSEPGQYVKAFVAILPKEIEAGERLGNILEEVLERVDGRTRSIEPLRLVG